MTVAVSGAPASGDEFQIVPSTPTPVACSPCSTGRSPALRTPGRTGSQIAQATLENLRDIDSAMGDAADGAGRCRRGAQPDRQRDRPARRCQKLASQTERSNAEDVDMVHAISEFQNKQSGYDAALKSYAMVQRLSLFQYVNG